MITFTGLRYRKSVIQDLGYYNVQYDVARQRCYIDVYIQAFDHTQNNTHNHLPQNLVL